MRELFIYYRVRSDAFEAARDAVEGMQRRLRQAHPGLVARLLHRPVDVGSSPTWMETYALPSDAEGVTAAIEATIAFEAEALRPLLDGARHCEVFIVD